MIKSLSALLVVVAIAVFVYWQSGAKSLSPREVIDDGISKMKEIRPLSPDQEQLLRVQLAIVDYIATQKSPPDLLNQLVPVYFDRVPLNPLTNKPFKYERQGGRFRLGGQVGKDKDGKEKAKPTKSKGKTEFINPNELVIEQYAYDPNGKRDPFEPFDLSQKQIAGDLEPLQLYGLGELKVTAILMDIGGNQPKAIVENTEGKGFTVKPGTLIGNKGGAVISIEFDKIKILETFVDLAGEEKEVVTEMKLHKALGNRKR